MPTFDTMVKLVSPWSYETFRKAAENKGFTEQEAMDIWVETARDRSNKPHTRMDAVSRIIEATSEPKVGINLSVTAENDQIFAMLFQKRRKEIEECLKLDESPDLGNGGAKH